MSKIKEKVFKIFSGPGIILLIILNLVVSIPPVLAIGIDEFYLKAICCLTMTIAPPSALIFWLWGLFTVLDGAQTQFSIVFYIVMIFVFFPTFMINIAKIFQKNK